MNKNLSVQRDESIVLTNPDSIALHLLQNPNPDNMFIIGRDADKKRSLETAEKLVGSGFPPENIALVSDFDWTDDDYLFAALLGIGTVENSVSQPAA